MSLTRRELFLAGLGLFAAGCASTSQTSLDRPRTDWPKLADRPRSQRGETVAPPSRRSRPGAGGAPAGGDLQSLLGAQPRSRWTSRTPIPSRVNSMGEVSRITVHHEGWTPFWSDSERETISRLESARSYHVDERGWGDIGYHYVVDRAGRVWEARPVAYQGAHVSGHNKNNIGILVLGNFDQQYPSDAQISTLSSTLRSLMRHYSVPVNRVYTHQELSPSACPGRNLQPRMASLRNNGDLG